MNNLASLLTFLGVVLGGYFALSAFRTPWGRKLRVLALGLGCLFSSLLLKGSAANFGITLGFIGFVMFAVGLFFKPGHKLKVIGLGVAVIVVGAIVTPKQPQSTSSLGTVATMIRTKKPVAKPKTTQKAQITKAAFSHQCKLLVIKKLGRRPAGLRFNQLDSLGGQVITSTFAAGRKEFQWGSWASYRRNARWMMARFICMYNNERGVILPVFKLERSTLVPADRISAKPVRLMAKPRVVAKPKPRAQAVQTVRRPRAETVAPKPRAPVKASRPAYRGNVNCNSFSSWDEAQAYFIAYSVRKLDKDSDGIACESLQ